MEIIRNLIAEHTVLYNSIIELIFVTNIVLIGIVCVKHIFEINLTVKINPLNYILWNIGAIATFLLLYYVKIIGVNHQSILLISFTWNKLFVNLHDKLNDNNSPVQSGINGLKDMLRK